MNLVGAWLRQLLKAGTAAALVPAAMLAALVVVLVGAGGFGGLGSLGQLLTGPQVSPAERLASNGSSDGRDVAPVAPAVAAESERPVPRAAAPPSTERTPPPAATRPPPVAVDPSPRPPVVRPPRPPVVVPPPADAAPPPPAAPARPPTVKERTQVLGTKLKDTLTDVGTAVEDIVDALGQTLGRIVNPPR
jgi:hypothetical protein